MAININAVRTEATSAVHASLTELYQNADSESMKAFAMAIAEVAVVAVQNMIDHTEIDASGQGSN